MLNSLNDNKIIDDVDSLMAMDKEELDELLLENKYNKAMLRELVRRCLRKAQEYKDNSEYIEGYYKNILNKEVKISGLVSAIEDYHKIDD